MSYTTPQADLPRFDSSKRKIAGGYVNYFRIFAPSGKDEKLTLFSLVVYNKGAAPLYILLFDINWADVLPTALTKPSDFTDRFDFALPPIPVGAGEVASLDFPEGWHFESGLTAIVSTTDTLVTLAGEDVYFAFKYE